MSKLYNYEYYHSYCDSVAYEDTSTWVPHFEAIADRIVRDLKPQTVLDAGCAMGYLVAALRDRGVEAYGVDISEYAISMVREDIRPYCVVGSIIDPLPAELPHHYDLVITIEMLEHLYEEEGRKAIKNLCALSECVIFSSTPDDFIERTHFNVRQREYWVRLFAEEGFCNDLNYKPAYAAPHAICFKKSVDWMLQVEDYERNIRISEAEWEGIVNDKERHIQNLMAEHREAEMRWKQQEKENEVRLEQQNRQLIVCGEQLEQQKHDLTRQCEMLRQQLAQAQEAYQVISNAFFWKITKPARVIMDALKALFRKR